jgi:hypothetical protein
MEEVKDKETKAVDPSLLSDAEKDKISDQVKKEIEKESHDKAAADYKQSLKLAAKKRQLMSDAKKGDSDEDGLVPIFIELPSVTECIRLDGRAYYPGHTYNVTPAVREVILECMGRGMEHEDTLNGKTAKENMFRKRNQKIIS